MKRNHWSINIKFKALSHLSHSRALSDEEKVVVAEVPVNLAVVDLVQGSKFNPFESLWQEKEEEKIDIF